MKTHLILTAAALALAACGSSAEKGAGGNGSAAAAGGNESAAAAAGGGSSESGISLQPGEWEMKTEVINVSAEGLPPGVAEGMKAQAGTSTRTCMTPEEAKGPKADMFAQNNPGNCKTEGFSWAGGRIKGKTVCTGNDGMGKAEVTMEGRYSGQSMDLTMKTDTDVAGKTMTMEMRISGRRVGECSAATKKG
jgi:hypothetical protein